MTPSTRRCAEAFLDEAPKFGFSIDTFLYSESLVNSIGIRRQLETTPYAGAVVYCRSNYPIVPRLIEPLLARGKPIVYMYNDCQGLPVNSINLNNVGLGYDAVRHFIRMGFRNILVLSDARKLKAQEERIQGAQLAFSEIRSEECRLKILRIKLGAKSQAALAHYLARENSPRLALFSCSTGALSNARPLLLNTGRRIPDELAIIHCTSKKALSFNGLLLDTMSLNIASKVGQLAAEQLHKIQSGEPLEKSILINARYLKRQTTP